jgi:lipopolysaccharide export system permease protein
MRVLDRYIVATLLAAVGMVALVMLVLVGLFLFISQQADIGTGQYDALAALRFVAMNLPEQWVRFLPVFAMIGSLVGLGLLAGGSELTAMRAAGVSVLRIGVSVAMAGVLLAAASWGVGEYLSPSLQQRAVEFKAQARNADISFAGRGGAWVRDGDLVLNIRQRSGAGDLGGVQLYQIGTDGSLLAVGEATSAQALPGGGWSLAGYRESRFVGDSVQAQADGERQLQTRISADFLGIAMADPRQMSVASLLALRAHLAANGQDTRRHDFTLWARVARVAAVFFAMLLGLPFVFGSLRSAGTGARATLGLVVGLAWFMLQKTVESGALAFDLPPHWLAWLPTLLLAAAVSVMVARLR